MVYSGDCSMDTWKKMCPVLSLGGMVCIVHPSLYIKRMSTVFFEKLIHFVFWYFTKFLLDWHYYFVLHSEENSKLPFQLATDLLFLKIISNKCHLQKFLYYSVASPKMFPVRWVFIFNKENLSQNTGLW